MIDATGKLVFPGGVEPHAHIHEPMHRGWSQGREVWLQPPEGATRAALFGGTTTVVSFAFMDVHVEHQELDCAARGRAPARGSSTARSYADFAFHPVLTGTPSDATLASVADAVADGTATFKFFTTDLTTTQTGIRLDNGSARALLEECARLGAVAMVHAEDDDLIKYMEAKLRREGRTQLANAHLVHTNRGEELAVRTVAALAEDAGAAVYFAHVCGEEALDTIAERRAAGQPVYGEVLHNCLCFSLDDYAKPDGAKYHIGMGLRPREDCEALWRGLADGRLSTLATDEYTTSYAVKMAGTDIESTPGGHVGIETRGLIGFSEGVGKRGLLAAPLRRGLRHQPGARDRPLPAQGRDRAGQRRRPRPLGPGRRAHDHDRRPAPRRRLQPLGGLGGQGLAGDDDPARPRRRRGRQAARRAGRRAVHPAQGRPGRAGPPALLSRLLVAR